MGFSTTPEENDAWVYLSLLKDVLYKHTGIVADQYREDDDIVVEFLKDNIYSCIAIKDNHRGYVYRCRGSHKLIDIDFVVSYLHDEIVLEWYKNEARYAFLVWPDDNMWLLVAHKGGELITQHAGELYESA